MISLLLSMALFGAEPTGPVLRVTGESPSNAVRFSVSLGERSADNAWSDFLDHWIELFDLDHDQKLSRSEANAVPALSNAAGSLVRLEFPASDPNGDDLISREELQSYYRTRGLSGINVTAVANDRSAIESGEILWELLDQDRNGQLSDEELNSASRLLNRWDLNEDECLSIQELPTRSIPNIQSPLTSLDWSLDAKFTADTVTIPLRLDALNRDSADVRKSEGQFPAGLERLDGRRLRVRLPSSTVVVHLADASVQRIVAAEQYLLGEIDAVQTDAASFEASQIRSDPTLDWLATLTQAVDTDRNEKLSESEIKSFVALLTEGAAAQVSITVTIRGRNLFDHLDSNADNQLDLRELTAAKRLIAGTKGHDELSQQNQAVALDSVPSSLSVEIRRGPISGRFGRMRIAKRQTELRTQSSSSALPRWFTAMDRNRDQCVSPVEFLGTPQRFQELDRSSDGVITSDEVLVPSVDQKVPPTR